MGEPEFVYETDIATTPEKLWAALTDGQVTRRYWFDRRIESDWLVGSPVRFYDGASDTVTDHGEVLECEPPRRLVYTFHPQIGPDHPAHGHYTRVAFDLEPIADGVRMRLVHDRLMSPDDVEGWREGWGPILANLKAMLSEDSP
jgi:uncharacterized protein YndB with AHSA1/START domain